MPTWGELHLSGEMQRSVTLHVKTYTVPVKSYIIHMLVKLRLLTDKGLSA